MSKHKKGEIEPLHGTMAVHVNTPSGDAVVGVFDLRVLLTNDEEAWFAQGLEIDYAAQGASIEDVQNRFQEGLAYTLREHLKVYGNIEGVLVPAPPEAWRGFFESASTQPTLKLMTHSQVSIHDRFCLGIAFLSRAA
jgi:hypothetical protein